MIERIMVPFVGAASSSEAPPGPVPLTWGQQHVWDAISRLGSPMNMCGSRELDPGATVDEFAAELRFYLERFESMRVLLHLVPDALPLQVIVERGEAPIVIVDAPAGTDPATLTADIVAEQQKLHFDYQHELPIRMHLVRQGGVLTHLVTTLSHLMTDAPGAFTMYNDFVHDDRSPVRTTLLDLAHAQGKPAARRASDASLAHWAHHLRSIPIHRFRAPIDTGEPRYWQVKIVSPQLFRAVRAIAARTQLDPSAVLLTIWVVAVTRLTGSNPAVVQTMVSNRFRPGMAETVNNISQAGLVVVDLAGVTIDEAVARTRRAATSAYKHAYFDFARWKTLIADVTRERGEPVDLACYYNDRPADFTPTEREVTPADVDAASRGPLEWEELPFFNEKVMFTIDQLPDAYQLLVLADTHHVSRAEMAALADDMHDIATEAAFTADTLTKID